MKKGHPKALYYLFFAELWERFSYYGMRALLVLYIVQKLYADMARDAADVRAYGIYAAFGALVYVTPVIGGMIADKFMGYRKSIMTGGVMMSIGLFLMTVDLPLFFYFGLGFLVTGNGLFKPNISSMVGSLYEPGDPRRDAGFTIFYMGINIGAWLSRSPADGSLTPMVGLMDSDWPVWVCCSDSWFSRLGSTTALSQTRDFPRIRLKQRQNWLA
jgi:proton-dependent oligopeptide transporter, POT family